MRFLIFILLMMFTTLNYTNIYANGNLLTAWDKAAKLRSEFRESPSIERFRNFDKYDQLSLVSEFYTCLGDTPCPLEDPNYAQRNKMKEVLTQAVKELSPEQMKSLTDRPTFYSILSLDLDPDIKPVMLYGKTFPNKEALLDYIWSAYVGDDPQKNHELICQDMVLHANDKEAVYDHVKKTFLNRMRAIEMRMKKMKGQISDNCMTRNHSEELVTFSIADVIHKFRQLNQYTKEDLTPNKSEAIELRRISKTSYCVKEHIEELVNKFLKYQKANPLLEVYKHFENKESCQLSFALRKSKRKKSGYWTFEDLLNPAIDPKNASTPFNDRDELIAIIMATQQKKPEPIQIRTGAPTPAIPKSAR